MTETVPDDLFAQRVQQLLMASSAQVEAARLFQADCARQGKPVSLAEALVVLGTITLAQRDSVVLNLLAQKKAGLPKLLHYQLLRKLGEGAMGAVYLAEDTRSARQVALKVLPRSAAARPDFVKRFQREADAAGRLHHPNLVRAFSFGEDQGWYFFVMEYCEGETQDKRLNREKVIPWEEATAIVLQVARGLQYAHANSFIHRDIKPSNILLAPDGVARILDLGLSKDLHDADAAFRTQSGVTVGTPHYMAPEQARGEPGVDGRADIYSLGSTFYHFITGDTPFHGSSAFEIVTQHLTAELPDPRDVREEIPESVVQVIRAMMAKRKEDRYADSSSLASDLERVLRGEAPLCRALAAGQSSVGMPRVAHPVRPARSLRPGPALAAAVTAALRTTRRPDRPLSMVPFFVGGAALAVVIVTAVLLMFGGRERERERLPEAKAPPVPPPVARPVAQPVAPAPAPKKNVDPLAETDSGGVRTLREDAARRQFDDLQANDRRGAGSREERIRAYEGFITSYSDTRAGREAREALDRLKAAGPGTQQPSGPGPAPALGPVSDAWIREVLVQTTEEQARRVAAKLQEYNPGYYGRAAHDAEDGRIVRLDLAGGAVRNLEPVRALEGLREITVAKTRVADLSPLRGMKLRAVNCDDTPVADLAPLVGMPLEVLSASGTAVADLAPLRGMRLTSLAVNSTKVADLAPLRGMPLASVGVAETPVADLSPLSEAPLREVHLQRSRVRDLAPLRGKALQLVRLDGTAVGSLEPLRGCPLTLLSCAGSTVTDLSPLKDAPLRNLGCDFALARDAEFLRSMETLTTVNEAVAASFWKRADPAAAFAKGAPALPAEKDWAKAVALLPLVDPARDALDGTWARRDGGLISDSIPFARLELPWSPPEEYDLRVEFTRQSGTGDVNVMLARGAARFVWQMAAYQNTQFGFSLVNGYGLNSVANASRARLPGGLENGRRYTAVILVRKEGLKGFLDGRLVSALRTDGSDLTADTSWKTRGAEVLGLGSYASPVLFHRVVVREVTGTGKALRAAGK